VAAGAPVVLEGWQGTLLELAGPEPGRLTANHLAVRARSVANAGATEERGPLVIERLDGEGGVEWSSQQSLFQAERASATFAEDGSLASARLEGLPRAQLSLVLGPEVVPGVVAEAERREVLVLGEQRLDVTWQDDGFVIASEGNSSVETSDFRLLSNSGLQGWLASDERSARFSASGGVEIESGIARLETQAFQMEVSTDAQGETTLHGTASGGPVLRGTLPHAPDEPTRPFTLTSPESIEIERSSRGWRVVRATAVGVTLEGPQGFRARADRVSDVDVASFRFVADGAIQFESQLGRFGGEHLEVRELEPVPSFVLTGTPEHKAYYDVEQGRATALSVEVTGESVHATGDVAVALERARPDGKGNERLELSAEELFVDRVESPELLPGESLRQLRLTAHGNARVTAVSGTDTLVTRSERLSFEWRERRVEGEPEPRDLGSLLIAEGGVHAEVLMLDTEVVVDSDRLEMERTGPDATDALVSATGNVRFQGRRDYDIAGQGELLTLDGSGHGTLQAAPHGRVTLLGRLPGQDARYRLGADRIDFEGDETGLSNLQAENPELRLVGQRARAGHLSIDRERIQLSGGVRSFGLTTSNLPWTLDAPEVVWEGKALDALESADEGVDMAQAFASVYASGGVDFRLGDRLRAQGSRLSARRSDGILRLEGSPASFETPYARLVTDWVEFDPVLQVLVSTGPGRLFSLDEGVPEPPAPGNPPSMQQALFQETPPLQQIAGPEWELDFLSSSTLLELDTLVFVVQEPVFRSKRFETSLRASWAVLWIDRQALAEGPVPGSDPLSGLRETFESLKTQSARPGLAQLLGALHSSELSGVVREIYFEGPVEVLADGELLARADAIYLDAVSQHGWLARATVNVIGDFIGRPGERLVVKADWLRLSSDGSLRADRATMTPCTFDEPHVRVVTGDLRIVPEKSGKGEFYRIQLKENRVEMYDVLRIPLPTIKIATDEELKPLWQSLSVADSARFGTLASFGFSRPADSVGKVFDSVVRGGEGGEGGEEETPAVPAGPGEPAAPGEAAPKPPPKPRSRVDANYKIDGSYLGSRGGMLDLGLEIEAKEDYWFDLYAGLVYDNGEDKGFQRVHEDDRSVFRRWLRSQAYFADGKSAWSGSYSDQSDGAVQSEFFESQFLRYERSETYVQWRRSSDENFAQVSAKVRVDEFRSDVEELPSVTGYRGRSPLFSMGKYSLVHTGDVRAEWLRRREGRALGVDVDPDSDPIAPTEPDPDRDPLPNPFGLPAFFPDGLGDRETARFDTTQALEVPMPVGQGWKLTPFVSGRATAWSEGTDESDSPTRTVVEGGARLGSTFWQRMRSGALNELSPFIEARAELERSDNDGVPVEYDALDQVVTGDLVRLGMRSRLGMRPDRSLLDLEVVGTHATDRSDGGPDGWLPIEVFGRLAFDPFGQQFELFHDARYDVENSETTYSLISLATRAGEDWGFQAGHQRARDAQHQAFFEAATVSAIYRWTEKWEFEGRQGFSLLEDERLDTRAVVRRYGHDIVFELETSFRQGEGSSFGISVRPRFGFSAPHIGYVPW